MYVIKVQDLSKRYTIGAARERYSTFRDTFARGFRGWARRLLGRGSENRPSGQEFWALRDVSFEVKRGECVGIIGRNGAGKSTLLKLLCRITEPTSGEIRIRGRVGSLLEVGTGFHPELTGRENIFLNGAILGMHRKEIGRKFDEIISFAEVEKFLDTPVKYYSSGMYTRLAFAVAAHLEPEILIIDEVLAVGDHRFQQKCLGKMGELAGCGRTVLFVSHNMAAISSFCSSCVLLRDGSVIKIGPTNDCISAYLAADVGQASHKKKFAASDSEISLLEAMIEQNEWAGEESFRTEMPLTLTVRVLIDGVLSDKVIVGFDLRDEMAASFLSSYFNDLNSEPPGTTLNGVFTFRCELPAHWLNEGRYQVVFDIGIANVRRTSTDSDSLEFSLVNINGVGSRFSLGRAWRKTAMLPALPWSISQ